MSTFRKNDRVTYTGTLTPRLAGKSGTVVEPFMRNGWVGVRFDGDNDTVKCSVVNLSRAGGR